MNLPLRANTARSIAKSANHRARAAVSQVDAAFALLRPPPGGIDKDATAGELLTRFASHPELRFKTTMAGVADIRKKTARRMKEAEAELDRGVEFARALGAVAEHIKSGELLPADLPIDPIIRSAAQTCRRGVLAGLIQPSLADEIRRCGEKALEHLEGADGRKRLNRTKSAATIAITRQSEELMGAAAASPLVSSRQDKDLFAAMAERYRKKRAERMQHHRDRFYKEADHGN